MPPSAAAAAARNAGAALKQAVRSGKVLTGLFLNSASPLVAEQLAMLPYDYMLVDIQHAPTDYQMLGACITAVNAAGKPALVRVEGPHDRGGIQQALDLGAAGIMVPTVNTVADVEKAVSAMYYPSAERPTGNRSISWPIRCVWQIDMPQEVLGLTWHGRSLHSAGLLPARAVVFKPSKPHLGYVFSACKHQQTVELFPAASPCCAASTIPPQAAAGAGSDRLHWRCE
jgi:hypothetical protein